MYVDMQVYNQIGSDDSTIQGCAIRQEEHDNGTSVSGLIAEVRKLRRLQLENNGLIDELRRQNQQLKQVLTENNSAIQRCIQKLEKTPQVEDSEVPGKDRALEVA